MIRSLFLAVFLCLTLLAISQQTAEKYVRETQYLLALPDGYNNDTAKKWPLLIFLHGSGESGNDLEKVKAHGPPKLIGQGKKFPFIVVSPQAPPREGWDPENLYLMIRHIKNTQRIDDDRVYLTGLSMGGFGTWNLAMKHPEEFAAIAPVCGGGDSADAWKLRHMAIWNFHGAKDDVVLPSQSEKMVKAARQYNPSVKYTLYPDANHNSWDLTYSNDSLYTWLLAQSRFRYKEMPVNATLLKQYTGKYTNGEGDTVLIEVRNDTLVAKPGGETVPLRYAGNDLFFIEPALQLELKFLKQRGVVYSFQFMGNRREMYRKVGVRKTIF